MFERIKAAFSTFMNYDRSVPAGVYSGSIGFTAGGPSWLDAFRSKRPPNPYELVNSFKSVAYACVQLNANAVCKVPLRLYAKTSKGQSRPKRAFRSVASTRRQAYLRSLPYLARTLDDHDEVDEITEHPFLDALDSPNEYFDGVTFMQHLARSLDVVGSSYFYPERPMRADGAADNTQARPGMKLWPLQSQYVYAIKGTGDQLIRTYRYFGDEYEPHELVRIRYISLRDPYMSAYSPLHACFEQVGLGDYYTAVVESIMKSGARPSMMVSPKDANVPMGEAERRRLEVDLNNRFGGGRSGHIWVNNGALEAETLTFPPADLAGLEITKWERLLVANCFDVPISLLQAEDSNRAVATEGSHQHQYYAVEPRCRLIASALTQQLARPVDDRLFFAFDDPVGRDNEQETKVWDMKIKNGSATINEAREDDGMEDVEWGDEPWLPQTLVQPSQQQQLHEVSLDQQKQAVDQGAEAHDATMKQGADQHEMAKEQHGMSMKQAEKDLKSKDDPKDKRTWDQVERVLGLVERDLEVSDGPRSDRAGTVRDQGSSV